MTGTERLKKLKWLSRRGMKELDILLQRFLAAHEKELQAGDWPELEALLQAEDDRLWDWLRYPQRSGEIRFHQLLNEIRHGTTGPY